jgi:hypothetical protein
LSVIDDLTGASELVSADDLGANVSDFDENQDTVDNAAASAEGSNTKRARARRPAKTTRTRR